ncbi:MAG: DUF4167 domain-containing protein [Parvibaculaceae bacterium]
MRPGQHNKRGRGRNRRHNGGGGGGGGGNPLNRVYESNGPDVKVRGTAQTVADKYLQLGRDAQVSGDIVMAESYYQHAEHYLRILAAAQAYQQQMQQQYRRPEDDYGDDEEMDSAPDGDDAQPEIGERPGFAAETGDQPDSFDPGDMRRDYPQGSRGSEQQGQGRDRHDRRDRFRPRWDRNRGEGQDHGRYGNQQNQQSQQPHARREEPEAQPVTEPPPPAPAAQAAEPPPAAPDVNGTGEKWDGPQPSFLKRPATRGRRPRREAAAPPEEAKTAD